MENFKIAQLTKELVASRLKEMDDPCAAAAALVKETLGLALKGSEPGAAAAHGDLIEEACKGGITGLLLAEQNLARGAVMILEAVAELCSELDLDPTETMRFGLKGLADVRRFLPPDGIHAIAKEIEGRYMGCGAAFLEAVSEAEKASPQNPTPAP